jgi:hypothetical protein
MARARGESHTQMIRQMVRSANGGEAEEPGEGDGVHRYSGSLFSIMEVNDKAPNE